MAHDLQPLVELQGDSQRLGEQVMVVGDQNAKANRVPERLRPERRLRLHLGVA